jgi:hypothetical protein
MDIYQPRTTQEEMTRHFIRMAEGHRPEKSRDGKLSLFPRSRGGQTGDGGGGSKACLKIVTPVAQAVEQAKSDLKRGVGQEPSVLDEALERDAKRLKLSQKREARRKRSNKKTKERASSKKRHIKKISGSRKKRTNDSSFPPEWW